MNYCNCLVKFVFALALLFAFGCSPEPKKLTKYYSCEQLIDTSGLSVVYTTPEGYRIEVVPASVFAVAMDYYYIIVKQHPVVLNAQNVGHIQKSITKYYILYLDNKFSFLYEENFIGPFDESEFKYQAKQLQLTKNLKFEVLE